MYGMSAWHENDSLWGCKEIFATNWAVAFCITFNAPMRVLKGHGHADVAGQDKLAKGTQQEPNLAVKKIFPETLSNTTNTTIGAVVD